MLFTNKTRISILMITIFLLGFYIIHLDSGDKNVKQLSGYVKSHVINEIAIERDSNEAPKIVKKKISIDRYGYEIPKIFKEKITIDRDGTEAPKIVKKMISIDGDGNAAPKIFINGDGKKISIDEDGNGIPVFDKETLFPKPGGGYCEMTNITDKEQYFRGIENVKMRCKSWGTYAGYKGCLDGFKKKDNCLVLSFGINFNFNFESQIIDRLGCKAYSFDPSMGTEAYERKEGKNKFFPIGLSSFKGVKKMKYENRKISSAKFDRYINILKMLELENTEIDFIKMDIEGSELDFFLDAAANYPQVFSKIRQIQLEIHNLEKFPRWHSGNSIDTTQFDMMKIVDILHCHGFVLAWSELFKKAKSQLFYYHGKMRGACYVNTWIRKTDEPWV